MNYELIKDKNILVTGGSGFLGKNIIERLLKHGPKLVRVISRDEEKLMDLKERFPIIEILTGDIYDIVDAIIATKDIDGIFHLAAFKYVGLAVSNRRKI